MRFEVGAALVIGITLPLLETCRRGVGEWTVDFTTMFTDYLAGALLLASEVPHLRHHDVPIASGYG